MESPTRYIAYYRVSTDKQGRSGLGLEAQQAYVQRFLHTAQGALLAEYTEVESGKKHQNRPELKSALAQCRKEKATLVIAVLDRLARNVHFISGLMESRVPFVCADMPHATPFEIHIRAAMAEEETRKISQRTKAALKAAKKRGVVLGNPKLKTINQPRIEQANAFAEAMRPMIDGLRAEGFTTMRAMVAELNRREIPTAKGGKWHLNTLCGMLDRL